MSYKVPLSPGQSSVSLNEGANKPLVAYSKDKARVSYITEGSRSPSQLFLRAAFDGNIFELTELIEKGVNVNVIDYHGYSALMTAVKYSIDSIITSQIVSKLLAHGADVNVKDDIEQETVLMIALKNKTRLNDFYYGFEEIRREQANIVLKLLSNGADVNATDINGTTPLMFAASNQYFFIETIKLLCFFGANSEVKDKNGLTALDHVKSRYKGDSYESPIIKFLETGCNQPKEGGKISRRKRNNKTRKINNKKKSRV